MRLCDVYSYIRLLEVAISRPVGFLSGTITDVFQLAECQLSSVAWPRSRPVNLNTALYRNNLVLAWYVYSHEHTRCLHMWLWGCVRVSFKTSVLRHFRRRHKVLQVGVWTHPSVLCLDVLRVADDTISKGWNYLLCNWLVIFKLFHSLKFTVKISGCSLRKKQLICQLDGRGPRMRDEILVIWPE